MPLASYIRLVGVKVIVVVGTRPEAIKMLPVVRALQRSAMLDPIVVATGQHGRMVHDVFALGDVDVDVDLGVTSTGSLNGLVADVMSAFGEWLSERFERDGHVNARSAAEAIDDDFPGGVLVHGDTSSALAAALCAFHLRIPVGHVEAGLRTGDVLAPFPEEMNRQVIGRIAAFHLAPTKKNEQNLIREGVAADRIFVTGNTGIDALFLIIDRPSPIEAPELRAILDDESRPIVIATAHRRDNWGGGLARIGEGIRRMVEQHPDVNVVLVTHPNPAARAEVSAPLVGLEQVLIVEALDYPSFAQLMAYARFAISDSGGIQEEAPALGTPVLVTRNSTERGEGVVAGTLKLVGTAPEAIASAAHELLRDDVEFDRMCAIPNPYGDGQSAERVVAALEYLAGAATKPVPFGAAFDRVAVLRAGGYPGTSKVELSNSVEAILE